METAPHTWPQLLTRHVFIFLVLPLLWAVAYLPQLQSRDLLHEEGRRAEPAAEMLQTGDWITPRIYGEPYLNKPPLFFWIAAGLGKIQGRVTELSIRIPSVISALLGAWLILLFAPHQLSRQTRALAALIFLSTPIMLDKGRLGEIDAFLSLITFISFVALWNAYDPARKTIALSGWIISGVAMAVSVLAKGPGGPIEFYAIFIPFLFLAGHGHWKILFSRGHFLMIAIAAAPLLVWFFKLLHDSTLHADTIGYQWADQLGLRSLFGTPSAFRGQREPAVIPWKHYTLFPYDIITMLFPWSLLAIVPVFPKFARKVGWLSASRQDVSEPAVEHAALLPDKASPTLWLLLAVSGPALLFVFWAYPMAFARHAMMIAYPVSILVALTIATPASFPSEKLRAALRGAAVLLPIILAAIAVAMIPIAFKLAPKSLPLTCVVSAIIVVIAAASFQLSRKTPAAQAPIAAACNLALLAMLGYGVVASVFNPHKAPSDATRILHRQIAAIVPAGNPIYTTRTLLSGKGNNYFNAQFYLPRNPQFPESPRAIDNFTDDHIRAGHKATFILAPDEWSALIALDPHAKNLGTLHAKNGPPPVIVAEAVIPPAAESHPAAHQ